MNKLTFYEQVGIVIPGAVFLFGLMFLVPALHDLFAKDGVSLGGLGMFVVVSYAVGQLVAALGNCIETVYWRLKGGMPSNWIAGNNPRLLSAGQIAKVEELAAARLGVTVLPLPELTATAWFPVFRQIYSDVERHGKPGRGDTFNGLYGLNRGLSAAALALAVAVLVLAPGQWPVSIGLLGISLIYLYRMQRFGVHYAREIVISFFCFRRGPCRAHEQVGVTTRQANVARASRSVIFSIRHRFRSTAINDQLAQIKFNINPRLTGDMHHVDGLKPADTIDKKLNLH